ncbi:hypothetical protein PQU95_05855 [Vogesella sp. DC21W]|uniref:Uncharacterized protein n=1 Tax=Vogesella aquatica TaxID=2984206 RepID=A0ABT5IVY8_9NEIS|nr:hypothetical protein [Vogesella aquatica]MDC7716738.1 hypothetical protein [Vogesella aquatica]
MFFVALPGFTTFLLGWALRLLAFCTRALWRVFCRFASRTAVGFNSVAFLLRTLCRALAWLRRLGFWRFATALLAWVRFLPIFCVRGACVALRALLAGALACCLFLLAFLLLAWVWFAGFARLAWLWRGSLFFSALGAGLAGGRLSGLALGGLGGGAGWKSPGSGASSPSAKLGVAENATAAMSMEAMVRVNCI